MIVLLSRYLFLFVLFSLLGWALEAVYRSCRQRHPVNPGFLLGPYLPIYGASAVLIFFIHACIQETGLLVRFITYSAVITLVELLTGEIIWLLYHKRYWDYSDEFMNFRGHICPLYSFFWGFLAIIFEIALIPIAEWIFQQVDIVSMLPFTMILLLVIGIDFLAASGLLKPFRPIVWRARALLLWWFSTPFSSLIVNHRPHLSSTAILDYCSDKRDKAIIAAEKIGMFRYICRFWQGINR